MNLLVLGCTDTGRSPWKSREKQTGKTQIPNLGPPITFQTHWHPCLCSLTVRLVVESHELHAVEPEDEGVRVGGVDSCGCRVGPEQLTRRVLDQLLGVAPAQPLGSVLVQGRDVVALGRPDDGAEGRWRVVGTARIFPGRPHHIKRAWKMNNALKVQLQVRGLQKFLVF